MDALTFFRNAGKAMPDLKAGKMFGAECFKTPNGKAAAIFWRDFLVVKLAGHELEEALKTTGASMFTPMEGRAMNGWVQIPYSRKNEWAAYLEASTAAVKKLPPNKSKKNAGEK